jgi:dGTPase
MITESDRQTRYYKSHQLDNDIRTPFEHDYDRLIYCSYLRRLACVTQIFNPSEGVIFHNRLTHTIKVSQIANRITQKLLKENNKNDFFAIGGLNCDVVSAAALAHDLGNPPFGHAGESELDTIIQDNGDINGFEGNAQSFRIVTKLATHNENYPGLNLTRATLNAILKYPWKREKQNQKKFGFYSSEEEYYNFAREYVSEYKNKKCLESSIMDLSDDITYAIHDLSDLLKQGLIPFTEIAPILYDINKYGEESFSDIRKYPQFWIVINVIDTISNNSYKEEWAPKWKNDRIIIIKKLAKFFNAFDLLIADTNYKGYFREMVLLKEMEDIFIRSFFDNLRINFSPNDHEPIIYLEEDAADTLIIIKALTKCYIINSTNLIKQQCGERKIIKELFDIYTEAISNKQLQIMLPARVREELYVSEIKDAKDTRAIRLIADAISGLTDAEAISTYYVLTGIQPGSIFDRVSF